MSIFSNILTHKAFCLETCTKEELTNLTSRLSEMNSTITNSLDAIGTIMFWATKGDSNGDNQIPVCDSMIVFSRIGELMQILSALSDFTLAKEGQCRDTLKLIENNKTPKTAIDGASNIQPSTI